MDQVGTVEVEQNDEEEISQLSVAAVVNIDQVEVSSTLGALCQAGELSMDTPDACNAEAILGWKKITSKVDEEISAKRDMAEVLTMAMNEMGTLLAKMKRATVFQDGTDFIGFVEAAPLVLSDAPLSALTLFTVHGTSIVLGHSEIDKTKLHVVGKRVGEMVSIGC